MTRRQALAELPPRLLNLDQAAAYCGIGTALFTSQCPVIPIKLRGRVLYDRLAIDKWIDAKTGGRAESGPGTTWLDRLDNVDANKRH